MADTGIVRQPAGRAASFLFFLLAALAALPAATRAEPLPIAATVLEVRGARVAVSADSGALQPGLRLAFADHHRRVLAAGIVTGLLDGTLASVRLDSGSLERVHTLRKLRVLAEPEEPPRLASVRVGIPANARRNLLVACRACTLGTPAGWRGERAGAGIWRAIHGANAETLLVRIFRDADDEEIAWERHELDVAVFWPGELSPSQRARLAPGDLLVGARSRGVLALVDVSGDSASSGDGARVAALNTALFGGDLLAWRADSARGAVSAAGRSTIVDASLPGARELQRWWDARPGARGGAPARLVVLDVAASDSTARIPGVRPLARLGCPILAGAAGRAAIERLGADACADLPACVR